MLSSGYVLKVNQTGIMDKLVGTGPEKEKKKRIKTGCSVTNYHKHDG